MSKLSDNVLAMIAPKGQEIALASQRGIALNGAWLTSCVSGIQQVMGENYVVSDTGIQPVAGHKPDVEELTERIANLAKATENTNTLKSTIMWGLGDICLMAGDEDVVAQAIKETGQSKHLIGPAMRLCSFFPPEKRVPGWSYTHFVEVMNHAKRFIDCPEVLEKVIQEAGKGKVTTTTTPEGGTVTQKEPISCKELRTMLQEASGKPVGDGGRTKKDRFFYIMDEGLPRKSHDLSKMALEDQGIIVVNLETMTILTEKFQGPVQELDGDYFPPEFEQEEDEAEEDNLA